MFERSSYSGTWVTRASRKELKSSSYGDFDLSQFPSKKWIFIRISIDEISYGKNETERFRPSINFDKADSAVF